MPSSAFPLISSDHLLLIHRTYGGEEGKQSLSRIDAASLDGSNRKTLITFNNGERLGDVFCTNGESLICSLTTLEQLPDTLESTFTLCMIDLNTGERVDLYVEDTTDGIQPEFLGVTETGYAVLHSSQQTKTESDFPGKEWSEISDEIARSTFHQWEKIPIGGNCCESFYEYTGNIQQLLMADGLYFYDVNTKKLIRISVQDSNIDEVADFISTDGNSAYIDGKFDEWLLMSIRHYEQHPNVEYTLLAGLLCALCFSGLFAMERKGGMDEILASTPLGRKYTVKAKLWQSTAVAAVIAFGTVLPHLWQVLRDYGLPSLLGPAMSVSDLQAVPKFITLSDLLLFWLICRFAACLCMSRITLWLGQKLGNLLPALFISAVSYCLPALLSLSGMKNGIEWLGFYPLFHAAALWQNQGYNADGESYNAMWIPIFLVCAAFFLAWAIGQALIDDYDMIGVPDEVL